MLIGKISKLKHAYMRHLEQCHGQNALLLLADAEAQVGQSGQNHPNNSRTLRGSLDLPFMCCIGAGFVTR